MDGEPVSAEIDFALDDFAGADLHEVLRSYRERAPVSPTRFLGLPAFVITGHEELLAAFQDTRAFPPHRMYEVSFAGAIGRSFISMSDPDDHRVYRKLATPAFRSRAVDRFASEDLAALAHELVDDFAGSSEVDLVPAYCARFPYLVITRLLGLPRERESEFHRWALGLLRFRDDPEAGRKAADELTRYLAPVVAARRADPRDDVISELVAARVEGRALSDEEVYAHIRLLFPTGGETTHGSLANLLSALLSERERWRALVDDPSLAGAMVDEGLRFETPIAVLPRMSASEDVELAGVRIPADSWVLFAIAGANRDPAVFDEPDVFDWKRDPCDPLTFGKGVKSCPGRHLARKNLLVALEVLASRLPSARLLDPESARPRGSVLRAPGRLLVAF